MVRTRRFGGSGEDVDWAKFLYDDAGELVTEEVSVIPKNIVAERRKRIENLLTNKKETKKESVDFEGGESTLPQNSSPSVERRHAILTFHSPTDSFSLKDLNSSNGTFLNNRRISSDQPESLNEMDLLRFGYDSNVYEVRTGSLPPKNEVKYSSQTNESSIGLLFGSQSPHLMQQHSGSIRGNCLYGSRVSSPSLTLDSGRGSSSAPSSPAKEMSPGPISSNTSAPLQSPKLSRKMTKIPDAGVQMPLKPGSRANSQDQLVALDRKDSLVYDVKSTKTDSEQDCVRHQPKDLHQSAIISNLDDLNVPNEVFEEQAKEELLCDGEPSIKAPKPVPRPRSFDIVCTKQKIAHLPTPTNIAPTPLYGTPNWWAQTIEDPVASSYKNEEDECERQSDSRPSNTENGPPSLNSESNMSVDSDTSNAGRKKVSPMAFTIDFDESPRKIGISDSISKFAPRQKKHFARADDPLARRNSDTLVLTKENGSVESNISNSKSIIEEGDDLSGKQPVSKRLASKIIKSTAAKPIVESLLEKKAVSSETDSKINSSVKMGRQSETVRKPNMSTVLLTPGSSVSLSKENGTVSNLKMKNITAPKGMKLALTVAPKIAKRGEKLDFEKEADDVSSETGTYTVDKDEEEPAVERARMDIAKMLGVNTVGELGVIEGEEEEEANVSTGAEWVREWAEQAAIQQQKIKELTDTQSFLRDTANVVTAMQERVTRNLSNNNSSHNSDSDDEATFASPVKTVSRFKKPNNPVRTPFRREASVLSDSGYQVGYQSDNSSNDGTKDYKCSSVKSNKPINIGRSRVLGGVGYDSDGCALLNRPRISLSDQVRGISPRPSTSASTTRAAPPSNPIPSFLRNDGGRFSLRMTKSRSQSATKQTTPPTSVSSQRSTNSKAGGTNSFASGRADPSIRKPVAVAIPTSNVNARKPPSGNRSNSSLTSKDVELANWRRRKSYDPMRAAAEGRRKRGTGTSSAVETTLDDISPTLLSNHSESIITKSMSFHMDNNYPIKCRSEEEDMIYVVDEVDSSHSNSPIHIPMTRTSSYEEHYGMNHSALRPKNKLEALDNLVIATIHSLSNKVRSSSRKLCEKLQILHANNENGALLEEMTSQLKDLEISSSNSSPNKSPSRELSGTLKNLKKLEQVILGLLKYEKY